MIECFSNALAWVETMGKRLYGLAPTIISIIFSGSVLVGIHPATIPRALSSLFNEWAAATVCLFDSGEMEMITPSTLCGIPVTSCVLTVHPALSKIRDNWLLNTTTSLPHSDNLLISTEIPENPCSFSDKAENRDKDLGVIFSWILRLSNRSSSAFSFATMACWLASTASFWAATIFSVDSRWMISEALLPACREINIDVGASTPVNAAMTVKPKMKTDIVPTIPAATAVTKAHEDTLSQNAKDVLHIEVSCPRWLIIFSLVYLSILALVSACLEIASMRKRIRLRKNKLL
jgi:hypothetical protein